MSCGTVCISLAPEEECNVVVEEAEVRNAKFSTVIPFLQKGNWDVQDIQQGWGIHKLLGRGTKCAFTLLRFDGNTVQAQRQPSILCALGADGVTKALSALQGSAFSWGSLQY